MSIVCAHPVPDTSNVPCLHRIRQIGLHQELNSGAQRMRPHNEDPCLSCHVSSSSDHPKKQQLKKRLGIVLSLGLHAVEKEAVARFRSYQRKAGLESRVSTFRTPHQPWPHRSRSATPLRLETVGHDTLARTCSPETRYPSMARIS